MILHGGVNLRADPTLNDLAHAIDAVGRVVDAVGARQAARQRVKGKVAA